MLCSGIKDAKKIVLSGDGRHDSMGHSAKYCAYSLFCHDPFNVIIDFSLVQVSIAILMYFCIYYCEHCTWHQLSKTM